MAPNWNVGPENGYLDCGFSDLVIYTARALRLTRTMEEKIYSDLYCGSSGRRMRTFRITLPHHFLEDNDAMNIVLCVPFIYLGDIR